MALRAIQKRIQNRPRKTSTITMSKISEFFKDCFRDPVVVPGDPDLNFREPVHTLGTRNPLDEASFAAIVVSKNMAQLFNTNLDSFHVLF